jgi:hypothetical protein
MGIKQLKVTAALKMSALMKAFPGAKSSSKDVYTCNSAPKDVVNSLVEQLKKTSQYRGVTVDADGYNITTYDGRIVVSEKGRGSLVVYLP